MLLYVRRWLHRSKHFTCIVTFNPWGGPEREVLSSLWGGRISTEKGRGVSGKWQTRELNPASLTPEPIVTALTLSMETPGLPGLSSGSGEAPQASSPPGRASRAPGQGLLCLHLGVTPRCRCRCGCSGRDRCPNYTARRRNPEKQNSIFLNHLVLKMGEMTQSWLSQCPFCRCSHGSCDLNTNSLPGLVLRGFFFVCLFAEAVRGVTKSLFICRVFLLEMNMLAQF